MDYDQTPFQVVESLVWIINNKAVAADKIKAAAILADIDPRDLLPVGLVLEAIGRGNAVPDTGDKPAAELQPTAIPTSPPELVSMAPPFKPVPLVRKPRDESKIKRNGGAGKERVKFSAASLTPLSDEALAAYYHTLGNKPGDVFKYGPKKGALRPNVVRAVEAAEKELKKRKRKDLLTL